MTDSDLDMAGDTADKLPAVLPHGLIDVEDEEHRFSTDQDVHLLRKAPVTLVSGVTGTLDGSADHTFTKGTDYQLVDDDGDGEDDSIDWSVGGDSPDDGTAFFVDYRAEAVISRYVGAHDADIDDFESDINDVISGAQVGNATGENLGRVGAIFGELGQRRGRTDDQYRALLRSIVQSFKGRGTKGGIEFAIAAGIGVDPDEVTVVEDTDNTGYEIEIASSVGAEFLGSVITDMATLADPSGVTLLSEPVILFDGDEIDVVPVESTVTATSTGLGGGTLTLDGNSTLGP